MARITITFLPWPCEQETIQVRSLASSHVPAAHHRIVAATSRRDQRECDCADRCCRRITGSSDRTDAHPCGEPSGDSTYSINGQQQRGLEAALGGSVGLLRVRSVDQERTPDGAHHEPRLEALVTAAEFSTLASQADQLTNDVDTLQAALAGIGNTAKAAKSDADAKQVAAVWKQFLKNIGTMLVNVPGEGRTSSLMGKYLDPPVGKGLLYWANQMSIFKDNNDNNELYSTATSALPLGAMLYYAGYEVQAAQFEALYYRSPAKYNGGGLPDTASCPAGSPATASPACQTLGAAAKDLAVYPDLIVPVLPDNTLLDLENNQMWITDIDGSQPNHDPVVPAGGCPGNAAACQNLFDRDAGVDEGHGSLSPFPENAYGALGANLTRGWIVLKSPIAGSENGLGKPADGGDPAFHIATSDDLANLIPKNPTAPTGTQSQTQPVSVRDWFNQVAGVEYDQTSAPDLWVGDATAPTYPVPIVNLTGWTPIPWNFQAPLCAYGGTNGMKNWASYLLVALTWEDAPNPGDCPYVGVQQPTGDPNVLPYDNDAPPQWQTNAPGVAVGPSDLSQAPWSNDYDDTVLRTNFVTPQDALMCRTSGTLATPSGGSDQGGTAWQIAGLAVDNGDGASFSGFPDDNPPFVTGPFNWSAADTDGLYFKGQVIDLTSKSFPQTQFSPKVHCGTSHGTMMLVRDAKANFYMNPTKN